MIYRNFTYADMLNFWRAHFKNLSQTIWSTRRALSIRACKNARTHRLTPQAPLKAYLGAQILNYRLLKTLTIFQIVATTLICAPRSVDSRVQERQNSPFDAASAAEGAAVGDATHKKIV